MKREILKDRVLTMMMDEERPLVRGRFYHIHAVVKDCTDYAKSREQAHLEIDSLFDKLIMCRP